MRAFLSCMVVALTACATTDRPSTVPDPSRNEALASVCTRLEESAQRELAPLRAAYEGPLIQGDVERLAGAGRCIPAGQGAWLVEITNVRMIGPNPPGPPSYEFEEVIPEWSGRANVALAYVLPSGVMARLPLRDLEFEYSASADAYGGPLLDMVTVLQIYDFNHDGYSEAWVEISSGPRGNDRRRALYAFQTPASGATIVDLEATVLSVDTLRDVDGDGAPDIVTFDPYWEDIDCSGEGVGFHPEGLSRVLHARPDGSFSSDDEVATAELARACAGVPPLDPNGSTIPTAMVIGCARIYGASEEEALRAVHAAADSSESDCGLVDGLERMAREPPPLRLHRETPPTSVE